MLPRIEVKRSVQERMEKQTWREAGTEMEKVTVIIPNYNGIKFIEECLEALLCQVENTPEYRILMVDNGSADGSLELVREQFPQVSVIALSSNTGFCHAVNIGIEAAETPYVILLNNDTRVAPSFVKNLTDALMERPAAFSVSAKMLMWDDPQLIDDAGDRYCVLGWAFSRGKGKSAAGYSRPTEIFSACGGAAIYRKSIFREIGLFDEAHFAYLEDLDIGYRARIYGYPSYYEPTAEVVHYGSASSGSRYNEWKTGLAASNNVYVIAKNMPFLQLVWNLPFLLLGFFLKSLFFARKGMGILYLKGLGEGIRKSVSPSGKSHKIPYKWKHLRNYLKIQVQLYINALRILKKS